nr:FAD-dependent oxidoreductase [Oricola thermophila]
MKVEPHQHGGGLQALEALGPTPSQQPEETPFDCAVIGAGPAGLAAATEVAFAGASVIVLDERSAPGGQYLKPLSPSHEFSAGPSDRQFRERERAVSEAIRAGAEIRTDAMVWFARRDETKFRLGIYGKDGESRVVARTLVLAQGAREKPWHVPGWTLPGVMTTGAAQTLARSYRVAPGHRIVVAGNGPLNLQVAAELLAGGANVVAVAEAARLTTPSKIGALLRATIHAPALIAAGARYRTILARKGVPLVEGAVVTAIEGRENVEKIRLTRTNGAGRDIVFETDAVCLGYGFDPSDEIARQLGVDLVAAPNGNGLVISRDDDGWTGVPGLFVAGDGAAIEGAAAARGTGALAGMAAAHYLDHAPDEVRQTTARRVRDRARKFQAALWTLFSPAKRPEPTKDTIICRCEDITHGQLEDAVERGARDIGTLKRMTRVGMGRCQGRYCSAHVAAMLGAEHPKEARFMPQAPTKPLPIGAIAREKTEWKGHREVAPPKLPITADRDAPRIDIEVELAIIGGGILGVSTALAAAGSGLDVAVMERGNINSGASGGNAGSLHVQLLSYDFGERAQAGGGPALSALPLQRDAVNYWAELEQRLDADFERSVKGGLMVAETEEDLRFLEEKAASERALGIDTRVIDSSELRSLAPNIQDGFAGAAFCSQEGKVNPLIATHILADAARAAGARIEERAGVLAIEEDRDGYLLTTARGLVRCGKLVIAGGGWSAATGELLGLDLPVKGAPLQMIVTEPAPPLIDQLLAHARRRLTLKQARNGNLIIGGGWSATLDPLLKRTIVDMASLEGNAWVACRTLPAVRGLRMIRSWAAMNVNIDGAPLIGPVPGRRNLWVAAMANGYTLGPMMGMELASMICSGEVPARLRPFTLDRFNRST